MRTENFDALIAINQQECDDLRRRLSESMVDHDICYEEKQVLSESLDRCKGANAAIIEQREELARQLRERKR